MNAHASNTAPRRGKTRPVKVLRNRSRLHANLPVGTALRQPANAPFVEAQAAPAAKAIALVDKDTVNKPEAGGSQSSRTKWTIALTAAAVGSGAVLLYNNAAIESPDVPSIDPIPAVDSTRQFEAELQTERERLSRVHEQQLSILTIENEKLKQALALSINEAEFLKDETLSLNEELLQLELALASANNAAKSSTDVKTVYNFVNVPVGTNLPPIVPRLPENAVFIQSESTGSQAAADNNIEYQTEDDIEYIDYVDEIPTEALVQELQDAAIKIYGDDTWTDQSLDAQIIYNPTTGFGINPEYNQVENSHPMLVPEYIEYPPLGNER